MPDPSKSLNTIFLHLRILGFEGIALLIKRKLFKNRILKVRVKGCLQPIYLRNGTSDITVFYQVFLKQSYDVDYPFIPVNIIDCGANIGLVSVFYKIKFPQAIIVAVEPEITNFNLLLRNTRCYKDIYCMRAGVWNKETNLLIDNCDSGNWGFQVKEVDYSNENTVKGISLLYLMKNYNFDKIDVLKIDIEGSEKELFETNYNNWLPKTKMLFIEIHDRLRDGASKSVFGAISKYRFSSIKKNENYIFHID